MKLTAEAPAGVNVNPGERQPLWATLPDSSSTHSTMETGAPCCQYTTNFIMEQLQASFNLSLLLFLFFCLYRNIAFHAFTSALQVSAHL